MTVCAFCTELREVVNVLGIAIISFFAEVACGARDGPDGGAQAVVTHRALLADILALLILIRSWLAWHSKLVTRA